MHFHLCNLSRTNEAFSSLLCKWSMYKMVDLQQRDIPNFRHKQVWNIITTESKGSVFTTIFFNDW